MAEQKVYQGHTYTRAAPGQPWSLVGSAQGGMTQIGGPDPMKPLQRRATEVGIAKTNQDIARTGVNIVGDKLSNAKTVQDMRKGGGLSEQDQTFLNNMRAQIGGIDETVSILGNAARLVDRFGTSPQKERRTRWGTEEADKTGPISGTLDWIGSKLFSAKPQDQEDWQQLKGLQNDAVLLKQQAQKGPQTESDAIRMQLASMSPDKYGRVNAQILGNTMLQARLSQMKPGFYTKWAQENGSVNAVNRNGKTADQMWKTLADRARNDFMRSNTPKRTSKPAQNDGWKIEEVK